MAPIKAETHRVGLMLAMIPPDVRRRLQPIELADRVQKATVLINRSNAATSVSIRKALDEEARAVLAAPVDLVRRAILKAEAEGLVAAYDANGKVVGVIDPKKIVPIVDPPDPNAQAKLAGAPAGTPADELAKARRRPAARSARR